MIFNNNSFNPNSTDKTFYSFWQCLWGFFRFKLLIIIRNMRFSSLFSYLLIIFSTLYSLSGQRFPCDGKLIVSSNDGQGTSISHPVVLPFSLPFFTPVVRYNNAGFDAVGFNSADNFIYAVLDDSNIIARLKSDYTYDTLGIVTEVDTLRTNAGDCTADGQYLCYDYLLNEILVFDVVSDFRLDERIELYWDPSSANSGPFNTRIYDFAIDPNDPESAYAFQNRHNYQGREPEATRGHLLKINLDFNSANLGMVTPVVAIDEQSITHVGGLLFSLDSGLYAYGSIESGENPPQTKFFGIDTRTGEVADWNAIISKAELGDGCSCPYVFTFRSIVPTEGMLCNGDVKVFKLEINNGSFNSVDDILLIDTLPDGMVIEAVGGIMENNYETITGYGTNLLTISGLDIPPKTKVTINIDVRSIDAATGPNYNQAFLYEMPERFEGSIKTDDVTTQVEFGDPSLFIVTPLDLPKVEWEVQGPTDCLLANDGFVRLKSEQFPVGQEYVVKMRNRIGWEESVFNVFVEEDNSFVLDSLIPGEYEVFEVRSLSDRCSQSIKDTMIIIEAPHENLQLAVSTNSPICEGETLFLNSEITEGATTRWTGPILYGADNLNPFIDEASSERSGEYRIVASYGFCEREDSIDVIVHPTINADIGGDTEYCERDKLQITAIGAGERLTYRWTGPQGFNFNNRNLEIEFVSKADEGYYEVFLDNGACQDTAGIDVSVLVTPMINYTDVVISDFCDPVILQPDVIGAELISYNWSPQEGLSCGDCQSPEIVDEVQSEYQLVAQNNNSCSDSILIEVILDKDRMAYTPNIFVKESPSQNDRFTFFPGCIVDKVIQLEIYDRWGDIVFENSGRENDALSWSGFVQGKPASSGVYVWLAKVELIDGTIELLSGNITLL